MRDATPRPIRHLGGAARSITIVSLSFLVGLCASPSQGKDWDLDRGQYKSDRELAGLAGPVREVVEETYRAGNLTYQTSRQFDDSGNLIRYEGRQDHSCGIFVYSYDSQGNLTTYSHSAGTVASAGHCQEDITRRSSVTRTYERDGRGAITRQKETSQELQITITTTYTYDALGRLVRVETSSPAVADTYTYAADPRGTRVTRRHQSLGTGQPLTFDITRELLYAPDGRLLEVGQQPSSPVPPFEGDQVLKYSASGYLVESHGETITSYSKHDGYGNWTESSNSRGVRIERKIKY